MEQTSTIWVTNKKTKWGLKEKLLLLLTISALVVFTGQAFEDTLRQYLPEQETFRSVINKKASGLSALCTLASRSGLSCQMWLWPYRRLSEEKGLLYVIEPQSPWTEEEVKEVLSWVKQGNQLIYFDSLRHSAKKFTRNILLKKLGLSFQRAQDKDTIFDEDQPEMAHVSKLHFKGEMIIKGGKPIVGDKHGAYVTSVTYGDGRILIGSVPEVCANLQLGKAGNYDNFQFMINCLRTADGVILFDEHCHGIQSQNNVFVYFSRRLPGLVCLQLLFILIAALLATRHRFGAVQLPKGGRQISDLAYVFGLANVYKRAQANTVALEIIVGFWKTKLCRQLGLTARASTDELLKRAQEEQNTGGDKPRPYASAPTNKLQWLSDLQQFLKDYEQALSQGEISKASLVNLISRCDALNKKMR